MSIGQQVAVQKPQSPVLQQQHQQQHQGYNIPIPKILARKQVEPAPPLNEYATQPMQEKGRKTIYNDYMSPEVIPTSPRQGQFQKGSLSKTGGWQNGRSGVNYSSTKDNTMESSLYTTGKGVKKGMMESQEKSKSGSRCIIRPKDLPGYKNY